jgi:hypothetical protein
MKKYAAFLGAVLASAAFGQIRAVPAPGASAICYRHEPITRVLCRVEVPPGGPLSLEKGTSFYALSGQQSISTSSTARSFYLDFPLAKEARAFDKVTLQERSRTQTIWVEYSVPTFLSKLDVLKVGRLEIKDISLGLVLPISYKAPRGDTGSYAYLDETGFQLIDGERGIAPYTASKDPNPPSYEWVGWRSDKVSLQFTLPSWTKEKPIKKISIGTFKGSGGIMIPSRITIFDNRSSGSAFEVDTSVYPPETPIFLTLEGEFFGPTIIIELEGKKGDWIFVDEVRFTTN